MTQLLNLIIKTILFFAFGLLFIFTPEIRRFQGSFGVQIPSEHRHNKSLVNIKRLYRCGVILCGLVFIAASYSMSIYLGATAADALLPLLLAAYFACALVLFSMAHKAVKALKARKVWSTPPPQSPNAAPIDRSFTESRLAPSAWWFCAHALLMAATALLLYFSYPHLQGYLPTMLDWAGNPASYAPKTPQLLCIPVLVQLLITLLCFGIYSMVKNSRLRLDPADAAGSLERSRRFRVVWSTYALALAFVLDLMILTVVQFLFLTPELRYLTPYLMGSILLVLLAVTLWLGFSTSEYAAKKRKK